MMVTQARVSSSGDRAAKAAGATVRRRSRLEGGGGVPSESESGLPSEDELASEGVVSYIVSWAEINVVVDFRGRGGGRSTVLLAHILRRKPYLQLPFNSPNRRIGPFIRYELTPDHGL